MTIDGPLCGKRLVPRLGVGAEGRKGRGGRGGKGRERQGRVREGGDGARRG